MFDKRRKLMEAWAAAYFTTPKARRSPSRHSRSRSRSQSLSPATQALQFSHASASDLKSTSVLVDPTRAINIA
jgi:hypothetical protein